MLSFKDKITKPLIVFDLETTGKDIKTARIISIGIVKIYPDDTRETYNFLINPEIEISKEATAIHGIKQSDVVNAKVFKDIYKDIINIFKDSDIAGYNIKRYDTKVLDRQMAECGVKDFFNDKFIYDAYSIYVQDSTRKLADALKFYTGQDIKDAHNAYGDVLSTIDVIFAQLERHKKKLTEIDIPQEESKLDRYLIKKDNDYMLAFGKYKNQLISKVDKGFLKWVLNKDFPDYFKKIVKKYV